MNAEKWKQVEDLFAAALERPPEERQRFLAEAAAGDEALLQLVERMLAADADTNGGLTEALASETSAWVGERADPVGIRLGTYRIVRRIGAGGMGTVYLARRDDESFEKLAAVKMLRSELCATPAALERLRRERQILAELDHPYIAKLLDGGATPDGQPYLVMEYVEGKPITEFAAALSTRQRCELVLKVCEAVSHAHEHLVIHRDIKPANILVTAAGAPKLLDFGIAKLLDHTQTGLTGAQGPFTPNYASPEQILGEAVTTATDVYALGGVLYELLSGRPPRQYTSTPLPEMVRQARDTQPPPLDNVPGDLARVADKALAADPAQRYRTVDRLATDIRRFLDGLPVEARPNSRWYRLRRFVGRHAAAVAASMVVVALLAGSAVYSAQQRTRAEERADRLHKLVHRFLFEFDDSIRTLAGANPARQLLVKTALEHLQELEKEGATSRDLRADMAQAYENVSAVQGSPMEPSLGDLAGSALSLEKALAIRRTLAGDGNRLAQLVSLGTLGETYRHLGRRADAVKALAQAIQLYDPGRDTSPRSRRAVAHSLFVRGRLVHTQGDTASGLADLRRARQIASQGEDTPALQHERALLDMFESNMLVAADDWPAAESAARRAVHGTRALVALYPDVARERHALMNGLLVLADVQRKKPAPDLDDAQRLLAEAVGLADRHAAADPSNVQAQLDLVLLHGRLAALAKRRRNWSASLASFQRCREILAPLRRAQPNHTFAMENEGFALDGMADALDALGRIPEAIAALEQSIELRRHLAALDQRREAVITLPQLEESIGRLYAKSGQRARAEAHLRRAVALWEEVRLKQPKLYSASAATRAAHELASAR